MFVKGNKTMEKKIIGKHFRWVKDNGVATPFDTIEDARAFAKGIGGNAVRAEALWDGFVVVCDDAIETLWVEVIEPCDLLTEEDLYAICAEYETEDSRRRAVLSRKLSRLHEASEAIENEIIDLSRELAEVEDTILETANVEGWTI